MSGAPELALLWTDAVIWLSVLALIAGFVHVMRNSRLRSSWRRVFADAPALCSAVVLGFFLAATVADSIHFRRALPSSKTTQPGAATIYDARTESLLDLALAPLIASREGSYSAPLAWHSFAKESQVVNGAAVREVARLRFGGAHLQDPARDWASDMAEERLWERLGGCWQQRAPGWQQR